MLHFKIVKILATKKAKFNNEYENIDHSGISFSGWPHKNEIGSITCEIKIINGNLDDNSELKFLPEDALLGDIVESNLNEELHTLTIKFRTIFFCGFDEMICELIKPNHNVIAISKAEKENFKLYENQIDVLEFLCKLYLPKKMDVFKSICKLAYRLEPTNEITKSFYNLDVVDHENDFIYCFISTDELHPYQNEFKDNFTISFKTRKKMNEISYSGYLKFKPSEIYKVKDKKYLKATSFLDLPSPYCSTVKKLNLSKYALTKYKTIYNSFVNLTRDDGQATEMTQLLGYPLSIQNDVLEDCEQNNNTNKIENVGCKLLAQITPDEIDSDFNKEIQDGMIYILANEMKEIQTIVQYT